MLKTICQFLFTKMLHPPLLDLQLRRPHSLLRVLLRLLLLQRLAFSASFKMRPLRSSNPTPFLQMYPLPSLPENVWMVTRADRVKRFWTNSENLPRL
jgi:hypothetical protein